MRLKRLIQAEKQILDVGKWTSGVKMPKSAFPLSKSHHFRVRSPFTWRVIKFTCDGASFRLLIFYRLDLSKYSAYLGREDGSDTALLARYEYDVHHGWHVHADCSASKTISGRTGGHEDRYPQANGYHRRRDIGIDGESKALYIGMKFFGLLAKDLAA